MKKNPRRTLGLAAVCTLVCACGGGGSSPPPTTSTPPPTPSATVTGTAAKGLLLNAIVNFYSVTNGVVGTTAIATVRTDSTTGAFSSPVSSSGPVVVVVTVDSTTKMLDEVSGVAITAPTGLVLHSVFDSLTNVQPLAVTPLTELAYDIANGSSGGLTTTNIDAANNAVGETFLAGAPVLSTLPIDLKNYKTATVAQQEQAKFLAALAVAASAGTATNASGDACTGTYPANLVCLIGGLANLLTLSSTGTPTLGAAATYIAAAYQSITSGTVTLEGGQLPSALGLNVATAAETAFESAIAKQVAFPGYSPGATPLANSKAFFADVRTNIVDATSQTVGYAPNLTALGNDAGTNVGPVLTSTVSILSAARVAAELIATGNAGGGATTPYSGFGGPSALALEASGNLLVAYGNNTIGQLTPVGAYTPYAGIPSATGISNGPALQATFNGPYGVAVDAAGNVYVADTLNNVIRKISGGVVTTLAGTGVAGSTDGPGAMASFNQPEALAVDGSGNIYVADTYNSTIRKITISGGVATVSTYAGTASPDGGFTDGTGGAASFLYPLDVAVDANGNVYVADTFNAAIRYITPASSPAGVGVVCTLAGPNGNTCSSSGPTTSAGFQYPQGIAVDAAFNVYVADGGPNTISVITPAPAGGVVSLLAGTGTAGDADAATGAAASFNQPYGIKADTLGNLYVADYKNRSIRKVATSNGATTTIQHGTAIYQHITGKGTCGWDPVGLGTATNVAICRYGGLKDSMLLTLTQTASGTYSLETQALEVSPAQTQAGPNNPTPVNPVYGYAIYSSPQPNSNQTLYYYDAFTPNLTYPALTANLALTGIGSATTPQSGTLTGPYYVNESGGQVVGSLTVAQSSNWNFTTGSSSLSVSGTLSKGAGGIALQNATIGSDSVIVVANSVRTELLSATTPPLGISGILDLANYTTSTYSYAVKFTIGTGVTDKSGELDLPSTVTLAGSIAQVGSGGATSPLFSGSIGLSFQGISAFNVTQPISATNFLMAQVQIAGTLDLSNERVLTVTATANASQTTPTPAQPDSFSATYSYSTPQGTTELNATGTYDATNGFSGTVTNNSGITATVKKPVSGSVTGTVTENGTETATISGSMIDYSDGTVGVAVLNAGETSVIKWTFAAGVVCALLPAALSALDLTVGAGAAQTCVPGATGIAFSAGAIAYLEPAPVVDAQDYGGGHYSPSRGNDIAIGIGYGELTGEVGGYCVGLLYRAEYRAEASRDILDALVANHFGQPFDTGRIYRLSLEDNSFRASGLRIRRVADFEFTDEWSATLGVAASVLKALAGQQESVTGSATATSGSYAVGSATWLKTDTNLNLADFNPFVARGTPGGYGFSTDLELVARSKTGYSIDLTVMDVVGRLYWHDVPQSYRILDNATITYNADFNRNAFVTGLDSRLSFVQALPRTYQLAATIPLVSKLSAVFADDLIAGYHFPSLGARYGELHQFGELDFDVRTKSLSIGAVLPFLSAMVTANSFDPRRATVLGITLRAFYTW